MPLLWLSAADPLQVAQGVERLTIIGVLALLILVFGWLVLTERMVPKGRVEELRALHQAQLADQQATIQRLLAERNAAQAENTRLREGYEQDMLPALLDTTRTLQQLLDQRLPR